MYPELNFVVGSAYDLPFCKESFDVVIMNNIWEHVPDPLRMLEGVARVIKPNGFIVISTPNRYRFTNIVRLVTTGRIKLVSTHHVTEYSMGQVIEQIRFSNFTVKEVVIFAFRRFALSGEIIEPFITNNIILCPISFGF